MISGDHTPEVATGLTFLYRMYDEDGVLLYVGISRQPLARLTQHEDMKSWWARVVNISLEKFPTRQEALAAEADAITAEEPVYNVQHGTAPPARSDRSNRKRASVAQNTVVNTIGFPDDLYRKIRAEAAAHRRSIASEVIVLVEEAIETRRRAAARASATVVFPGSVATEVQAR